jgi:hypothetical protein
MVISVKSLLGDRMNMFLGMFYQYRFSVLDSDQGGGTLPVSEFIKGNTSCDTFGIG